MLPELCLEQLTADLTFCIAIFGVDFTFGNLLVAIELVQYMQVMRSHCLPVSVYLVAEVICSLLLFYTGTLWRKP